VTFGEWRWNERLVGPKSVVKGMISTPLCCLKLDRVPSAGMSWADLGRRAKAFRIVHTAWSVVSLACLGYIWACAATGRRDRRLWASVAFLSVEGAGLAVGRGNCPMGPLQAEWGDPVPLFELVLPPRAAKAAVPVLAGITVAGIALVVVRRPPP